MIDNISSNIPYDLYKNISIDNLVVLSVKSILDKGEECTFERLVYECFSLFPKVFGFVRYPQWPDSSRINKAWLRCRTDKGWIEGSVKSGFKLTLLGKSIAKNTEILIRDKGKIDKVKHTYKTRERYESILRRIKNSEEYRNYNKKKEIDISESDLRYFLGGTLETPKRILLQNLHLYFESSKDI